MEERQGEERKDDEGRDGDGAGDVRFAGLPDYGCVTHFTKDRNKGTKDAGKPNLHGRLQAVAL